MGLNFLTNAWKRWRAGRSLYEQLLEGIQDGVLIIQEGRIVYANDVFAQLVQDSREGLIGHDFRELAHPEERADLGERYLRWEQTHAVSGVLESRVITRGGETRIVSLRAGAVDFEGRRSVIATVRDITRERKLEEDLQAQASRLASTNRQLEDLDRLRMSYLRNVSHEFRTPLTLLKGYTEFIFQETQAGQSVRPALLAVMLENCDRLIDMVETLLDVSRAEKAAEAQTMNLAHVNFTEVLIDSVNWHRAAAAKRSITLDLSVPLSAVTLDGDGTLLRHVVHKLLDNAVKYGYDGSTAHVRAEASEDDVTLTVEDTGLGIEPAHLPRIFDKFYTGDGSLARSVGGTGMGLYLVREVVKLHRGQIEVQSEKGKGSVFQVRLPRRATIPIPQAADESAANE